MELYSLQFLLFILILAVCYYTVMRRKQWWCLLIGSIVFYSWTGIKNLIIIVFVALLTWCGGLIFSNIDNKYKVVKKNTQINKQQKKELKRKSDRKKRLVLIGILVVNFGILSYFKYWDTIFNNIADLFLIEDNISFTGMSELLLPLGISFYIFQAAGYLLDVYGGKYEPEGNFLYYFLFISFFPQLIQGPINRYAKLATQFHMKHSINWVKIEKSCMRIAFGMMKKYAIANLLASGVSVILDGNVEKMPGSIIVLGVVMYSIQQYADFSGGIDIVLGVAEIFDIHMMENFRQPYFATSLGDFWRRWHISLGAWMRDYVFYPFALTKGMQKFGKKAGDRLGKSVGVILPACIANILVFFIVGLWHGAQLHFILWGLYNGIIIAVSDLLSPVFNKITSILHIKKESSWFHVFQIIRTFIIVNIGGYFDRIENVESCFSAMQNTIISFNLNQFNSLVMELFQDINMKSYLIVILASIIVFMNSVLKERGNDVFELLQNKSIVLRWGIYYAIIFLTLLSFTFTFAANAGGFMYANF